MARSKRAGARREVLDQVNELKKSLTKMTRWWKTETTIYVDRSERQTGDNSYLRERELHEYPEYQENYWYGTITEIDDMMGRLRQLREHCVTEFRKTERGVE